MIDPASDGFKAVKAYAEKKIEDLRNKLERQADQADTAYLRGQIFALRELLALAEPKTRFVVPPQDTYGMGDVVGM